jgi:hypothetical protein
MFQTKIVEEIKTYILYSTIPLLPEKRAVYEIMWKNIVETGRPQVTIWCMRVACWIPKAKNTQSEYVILIDFPLQHWLHERASALRYTYTAFCCFVLLLLFSNFFPVFNIIFNLKM